MDYAKARNMGFLPGIDAQEGTMMQVLDRHVGKVRVIAYTVASRQEVPSVFSGPRSGGYRCTTGTGPGPGKLE